MIALDLFCGGGGASRGLANAGFGVIGVDINPQPNYPFEFIQADATTIDLSEVDFIWASPPCQRYSASTRGANRASKYPDLVPAIREKLSKVKVPWVIENVVGAPLINPTMLCGTMFGLNLQRHRIFESNKTISAPGVCNHTGFEIPVYGKGTSAHHLKKFGR